jgi:hypothetical protein
VLGTLPRKQKMDWRSFGKVQLKQHQPVVHRTFRWCTAHCPVPRLAPATNSSLSGKSEGVAAKKSSDCPVCTGLSGEPTAPVANGRQRNQRATCGPRQRSVGYTGQCPVRQRDQRPNGRLRPIRKEIGHRIATVHVR